MSFANITPCMKCKMVYYCSSDHSELDKKSHKELCKAIQNIAKYNGKIILLNTVAFDQIINNFC